MAKEFSQFTGPGRKYAPKSRARQRSGTGGSGSSGTAATRRTSGTPNPIRNENQVRQDMMKHRSRVMRMGAD